MPSEVSAVGGDQSLDELKRELAEAREQQAVTADILRVISSSPMDLQRVFADIAASAARLCDAYDASIFQVDGDILRLVANHGSIPPDYTLPLMREVVVGRAVLDSRTIQIADLQVETGEYPVGSDRARLLGHRTILAVPLIRAGEALGVIGIRRTEARLFSEKQIALLGTFTNQAVIAIENTRLFEEVQARTRDLTESLEQQTATSEVLGVISSSPGSLQPVFEAMLSNAVRVCGAEFGNLSLSEGDVFRLVATHGALPAFAELRRRSPVIRPSNGPLARIVATKQVQHVADITREQTYLDRNPTAVELVETAGARTLLGVPMLKDNELIGVIVIYRQEVRPFTHKQIELVKNFANQAVIALENTRLLNELRASLQQQTATADVLKVISRAAFDLPRVLDTLVESAATLCDSYDTAILQKDGDVLRIVSHRGQIPSIGREGIVPWRVDLPSGVQSSTGKRFTLLMCSRRRTNIRGAVRSPGASAITPCWPSH